MRSSSYHKTKTQIDQERSEIEAAKRNPRRFGVVYNRYYEQIFLFVFKRVGEEEAAADVTSRAFLKAMQNLEKYEFRGLPFSSWLFRIASNEVNQHFRRTKAKRTITLQSYHVKDMIEEADEDYDDENMELMLQVLDQLPVEDVQLIEMRFFEKRPFKEIADILDITENNAKVKTYRLLNKMKKLMIKKRVSSS